MKNKRKFNFSGAIALVIAVLLLLVLVPINMAVSYFDKSFDMTAKSTYEFTDTTMQLLEETKNEQIDIYFLYPMDLLRQDSSCLALYYQLGQFDKRDNITLHEVDIDAEPQIESIINPSGTVSLKQGDIVVKHDSLVKHISRSRIFPYKYADADQTNQMTSYAGEELLAGAIKIVTGGSLPTIYFMTGHGEPSLDNEYSTVVKMFKQDNYDVKTLDLVSEASVPADASIVLLAGPTEDITSDEADKLLDYASNGGNISMLIPPCEKEGRFTNIEKVLEKYEIGLDYNIITETAPVRMMTNRDSEQDASVFNITFVAATDSFTVDLTSEILSQVDSLNGIADGISNTRSLYRTNTSDSAFLEKSALITNTLSADYTYTTKSTPCGGNAETAGDASKLDNLALELAFYAYNKSNGSKLVVFGTDDIIRDPALFSTSLAQTQFLTTITWMYNSDVNMDIGNKDTVYDYLTFRSAEEATSVMNKFIIAPIVIAVFGAIVWLRRRHS